MGTIPRFSRPGQFDRYCKLVLEHEAIDYLRKMDSLRDRHVSLSILPQKEMDKLSTVDRYPSESHVFTSQTADFLSSSDCSRALRTIASCVTALGLSPSEYAQYKADILELFEGSFVQQDFMLNIEKEYYDALPDVVTVYHGVNEENGDYEISDIFCWTTEIEQLVPTADCRPHLCLSSRR